MNNDKRRTDALITYLELCELLNEVPRRFIYQMLAECDDLVKLESSIRLMEKEIEKLK